MIKRLFAILCLALSMSQLAIANAAAQTGSSSTNNWECGRVYNYTRKLPNSNSYYYYASTVKDRNYSRYTGQLCGMQTYAGIGGSVRGEPYGAYSSPRWQRYDTRLIVLAADHVFVSDNDPDRNGVAAVSYRGRLRKPVSIHRTSIDSGELGRMTYGLHWVSR